MIEFRHQPALMFLSPFAPTDVTSQTLDAQQVTLRIEFGRCRLF
jgi:hypothetical protein